MKRVRYVGKRIGPVEGGGAPEGIGEGPSSTSDAFQIGKRTDLFIQKTYPEVNQPHYLQDLEGLARNFYQEHTISEGAVED